MLRKLAIRNARFLTKNLSPAPGAFITFSSTWSTRFFFRSIFSEAKTPKNHIRGGEGGVRGGDDDNTERAMCPGCGIRMQKQHRKAPGFFLKPPAAPKPKKQELWVEVSAENAGEVIFLDPDATQKFKPLDEEEKNASTIREEICGVRAMALPLQLRQGEGRERRARLMKTTGSRSTVLMVVDTLDFDGSFPRRAAALLSRAVDCGGRDAAWRQGRPGNVLRVVVVATKLDLLPPQVTPERLEKWVRQRSHLLRAVKVQGVQLVSAHRGWGIHSLALFIRQMTGPRGNVWVMGAQNAGKSTLINAIGKCVGGSVTHLTEAPVPGTTVGIIRVDGILSAKA